MKRIVVVGASLAGLRTAQALRAEGFSGELTLVGDEPHRPYDRPPLSKAFLAGGEVDDLMLAGAAELRARWRLGQRATGLDLSERVVGLADGSQLPFDRLVIATGVRPRQLPSVRPGQPGVLTLRTR